MVKGIFHITINVAEKLEGVAFFSEPQVMKNSDGTHSSFVCFTDPDGTVIELIQFK
jgi:hypothetical protein